MTKLKIFWLNLKLNLKLNFTLLSLGFNYIYGAIFSHYNGIDY